MINSLSIILPVYNESSRLPFAIKDIYKFLKKKFFKNVEIIFVDDGSSDDSSKIINNFIKKYKKKIKKKKVKILKFQSKKNLGKGSALKLGVKKSKGAWILTADVDMSVNLNQICSWVNKGYIENKKFAYFGSRNHEKSKIVAKFYRVFLGNVLRLVIFFLLSGKLHDTQCGYKLYNKTYAKNIFGKLKSNGFAHDLELVTLLKMKNIKIKELPVNWKHKDQSKLNIFIDPIKMLFDIILIKLRYFRMK